MEDSLKLEEKTFDICRVCLKISLDMNNIFEAGNDYAKILSEFGKIDVQREDGLPMMMCKLCTEEMLQCFKFSMKCQDSDRILRDRINGDNAGMSTGFIKLENLEDDQSLQDNSLNTDSIEEDSKSLPTSKPKDASPNQNAKKKKRKTNKVNDVYPKKCTECNFVAKYKSVLAYHMTAHKPYTCEICGKVLKSYCGIKGHFIRNHAENRNELLFKCDMCEKRFFRKKDLVVHIRVHTGETPYECTLCPKKFTQVSALIHHTRKHTGEKPYKCTICEKSFVAANRLSIHQAIHSDERKFSCAQCGAAFKTKPTLRQHMLSHKGTKDIVCDQCGMTFAKKAYLSMHTKKIHSEKAGYCAPCKKQVSNLKEHSFIHTEDKPFKCHLCSRAFNQRGCLSRHVSSHSKVKKYCCTADNCSEKFAFQSMLTFHELKFHAKQSPFSCKLCAKSMYRMSDLKKHMRVYHAVKSDSVIN